MNDIPDHLVIQNMERTGYPSGNEPEHPICPACGSECDTIYVDNCGDYIGCENCVTTKDAWEVMESISEN